MITLIQAGQAADQANVLTLTNELDPRTASLEGVDRVELQFPKFSDDRAYSQAVILRKRMGFRGDIRATGDVLIDQLVHMERTGFSSAVLKDDKDPADAQRQFTRFAGFYQGDVVTKHPLFARG
jgi:uncharacterized protein (DUF934 family)